VEGKTLKGGGEICKKKEEEGTLGHGSPMHSKKGGTSQYHGWGDLTCRTRTEEEVPAWYTGTKKEKVA